MPDTGTAGDAPPVREHLASYAELADILALLPVLLREARRSRHLTMQQAADQMSISAATVCRIEAGENCRSDIAVTVLRWLDTAC